MTRTDTHKPAADAAMTPTGLDIDNDHADQRPVDRSQDAPEGPQYEGEDSAHGGFSDPVQPEPGQVQGVVDDTAQMESGDLDDIGNSRRSANNNPPQID